MCIDSQPEVLAEILKNIEDYYKLPTYDDGSNFPSDTWSMKVFCIISKNRKLSLSFSNTYELWSIIEDCGHTEDGFERQFSGDTLATCVASCANYFIDVYKEYERNK